MSTTRKVRKNYTPEEKVAILRQHLVEKVPVSKVCEAHQWQPNLFYEWQRIFFENGAAAFQQNGRAALPAETAKERKIAALEAKLVQKNEVVAELLQEHVQLKKELGELPTEAGFPTTRATRSWITSAIGRARPNSRSGRSSAGSALAKVSFTIGEISSGRSTSTTRSSRATIGCCRRNGRPSWISMSNIRSTDIAG
jgi:transposase